MKSTVLYEKLPTFFSNILNESFLFIEELVKFSINHEYSVNFVSNAPTLQFFENL